MKFVALVALMTLAASASAQTAKKTVTPATWQTVWFQYNPSSTKSDYDYYNNLKFTGLSLGYSKAFHVSQKLPLYVEGGIGVIPHALCKGACSAALQMGRALF